MNLSTINRCLLALWGVVLGFLFVLPREAAAQERPVPTDIPSCHEYAQPNVEAVLTAPVELPHLLAGSWNGGTREQLDGYFNRQQPFPATVLANGLPTRLDRRGIGPRNWLRPGTDNAFRCEFRTDSSTACANHVNTSQGEGTFISLIDLLRVNPLNRFQATVTVTEEFIRPQAETPVPVSFPQSQTLRRSPNQAGVPAGSVRWIYTATANLTPNCQGRPTAPLFVNGIPTLAGRAYLANPCTAPVNAASLETLYGWNAVQRHAGSTLTKQFKIRALPGRVLIPRSTAFRSVAEQACLTLPRVPATVETLRCDVAPSQLTAWNQALIPATVMGAVANDLREAAQAASARLNGVLEGPKCVDARTIATAQGETRMARGQRDDEGRQKRAAQATSHFRGQVIVGLVVGFLASLLVIGWLLVTRSRQKTIEVVRTQMDQAREAEDASVGAEIGFIFEIAKKYLPFFADSATASFASDIKARLERKGIEDRRLDLLAVVSLVLQAAMLRMTRLSDDVTSLNDKVADLTARLEAVPATGPRASFSTPITGISGPMGLGAHAFFRFFTHETYSDVRAGRDPTIRAIRDRIMALTPETPVDVWKELGTKVAQHVMTELDRATRLEMARIDLIALFSAMGRTEPHGKRQAQAQLTQVQARLSVMAELLEDERRLGDERLGVQLERRFSQQTATHVAGREQSGEHRREAPPKDPRVS